MKLLLNNMESIRNNLGVIVVAAGLIATWAINDYRINQLEEEVAAINPVVLEVKERLISIETKLEFLIKK